MSIRTSQTATVLSRDAVTRLYGVCRAPSPPRAAVATTASSCARNPATRRPPLWSRNETAPLREAAQTRARAELVTPVDAPGKHTETIPSADLGFPARQSHEPATRSLATSTKRTRPSSVPATSSRASGVGARHAYPVDREPSLGASRAAERVTLLSAERRRLGPSPNTSSPMISPSSGPLSSSRSTSEDAEVSRRGAFGRSVSLFRTRSADALESSSPETRPRRSQPLESSSLSSEETRDFVIASSSSSSSSSRVRSIRASAIRFRRSMARALRSQPPNAASREPAKRSAAEVSLGSPSRG